MRHNSFVFVVSLILIGCAGPQITVKDANLCTVAGIFQAGGDCATTNSGTISSLSFMELVDFLEPQAARVCAPVPGFNVCADNQAGTKVSLPARAGAVIEPDDDFTALKTALEQACVELKDRCVPEVKTALAKAGAAQARIHAAAQKRMSP